MATKSSSPTPPSSPPTPPPPQVGVSTNEHGSMPSFDISHISTKINWSRSTSSMPMPSEHTGWSSLFKSQTDNVDSSDQPLHKWPGFDENDERTSSELSDSLPYLPSLNGDRLSDDDDGDNEYDEEDDDDDDYELFLSDDLDYDLEMYLHPFDGLDRESVLPVKPPPPYPHGAVEELECWICFEDKKLRKRICCNLPVCDDCIETYLVTQVNQGIVKIECMETECSSYVHRDEILARLPADMKDKFYKFLVDANKDPNVKTCPRCSHVMKLSGRRQLLNMHVLKLKNKEKKNSGKIGKAERKQLKDGIKVECPKCQLEWCFPCQAPWHEGVTCKQYKKGDKLVRTWANKFRDGQQNAQKCPKCKIFVERTTGCDHMTCSQCRTNFCYRCGDRYWGMKLLGDHFSRFSPFGCKYNFMPERPGTRRFVRGAVLSGKLLGGVVLAGLALAAGVTLLGLSVVALPAIGGYKYHMRRKRRKRMFEYFARGNQLLEVERRFPVNEQVPPFVEEIDDDELFPNNLTVREWMVLGMEMPDSHQVEVLVHKPINADGEEQTTVRSEVRSEVTGPEESGTMVTITDVTEVKEEGGYTRIIANIVSKMDAEDEDRTSGGSESRSESRTSKDSVENGEIVIGEQTANTDADSSKSSLKSKDVKSSEEKVELDVKESNGCFANIFTKKLNSLQHTALDIQQSKFPVNTKGSLKRKSGTWEKSRKKDVVHCSNSLDIKNLSAFMATTSADGVKTVKCRQEDIVAADTDSRQESCNCKARDCGSTDSEWSMFCEKCGCAPLGHAYPCDIVTYL